MPDLSPSFCSRPSPPGASATPIIGRWKDMYISGGENVYPAEVESVLYQLPEIAEVSVIGVPDDKWVEVGRACVVLKEGRELTEQAIIAHCRANLARFKVPRSWSSSTRSRTTPPARC